MISYLVPLSSRIRVRIQCDNKRTLLLHIRIHQVYIQVLLRQYIVYLPVLQDTNHGLNNRDEIYQNRMNKIEIDEKKIQIKYKTYDGIFRLGVRIEKLYLQCLD